jgi:hypothetical protein
MRDDDRYHRYDNQRIWISRSEEFVRFISADRRCAEQDKRAINLIVSLPELPRSSSMIWYERSVRAPQKNQHGET